MITKEKLQEAIDKFPTPKITTWYLTAFPKKEIQLGLLFAFCVGFVSTAIKAKKVVTLIATLLFCLMLIPVAFIHTYAWVSMRRCEKKRAKYLGVSLQEYQNAVNTLL